MVSDSKDPGQDAVLRSALPHVDLDLDDSRDDIQVQVESICSHCLLPQDAVMADHTEVRLQL